MLLSQRSTSPPLVAVSVRWWRVTTAVRVFALAMATGQLLSSGAFNAQAALLATLVFVAGVSCALEWGRLARATPWIPVGEALIVALVVASASPAPPLLTYLAVPPIVAGVRHGLVATFNAAFVAGLAFVATLLLRNGSDQTELVRGAVPWLAVGLGAGLLASWQSKSARGHDARQAPYAAAHHLMARLHELARTGTLGLDPAVLAAELDAALRQVTDAARCAVFVADAHGQMRPVVSGVDDDRLGAEILLSDADRTPGAAVVPLRGANQLLGYCVLVGVQRWSPEMDARATAIAEDFALRLDTAVLFDEVRHLATAEERNRIAREMHDGVAQEIVALGYVVDEIASLATDEEVQQLATTLRSEVTRVVTELRYSIFDLRHSVDDLKLTTALTEYVQEISRDTDLRVHLVLESTGPQLPVRTSSELMRIAQEAIGNVRRHASATNLWVTYVSDGRNLRLEVADDGIGDASPKDRHWGLQTMQERAAGLGAYLTIEPREGGGTVVDLRTRPTTHSEGGAPLEYHGSLG